MSNRIEVKNYAMVACSVIGTGAGAIGGALGSMRNAKIGCPPVLIISPLGTVVCGIAGAIIGGIAGATAGGATGAKLGAFIDDAILLNYCCQKCKFRFGKRTASLNGENASHHSTAFNFHQRGSMHGTAFCGEAETDFT